MRCRAREQIVERRRKCRARRAKAKRTPRRAGALVFRARQRRQIENREGRRRRMRRHGGRARFAGVDDLQAPRWRTRRSSSRARLRILDARDFEHVGAARKRHAVARLQRQMRRTNAEAQRFPRARADPPANARASVSAASGSSTRGASSMATPPSARSSRRALTPPSDSRAPHRESARALRSAVSAASPRCANRSLTASAVAWSSDSASDRLRVVAMEEHDLAFALGRVEIVAPPSTARAPRVLSTAHPRRIR